MNTINAWAHLHICPTTKRFTTKKHKHILHIIKFISLMQNYTIKVLLPLQNCKPISLWGDSTLWCDWMADQTKLAISQLCFFGCILSHATKTVIPCPWCQKTVCWQNIFITVKTMLVLQMHFSKFQLPCNTFF